MKKEARINVIMWGDGVIKVYLNGMYAPDYLTDAAIEAVKERKLFGNPDACPE